MSRIELGCTRWLALVGMLLTMVIAGCGPVRLISPYDQVLDQGTTDVHTRIVAFVHKMEGLAGKPEGTYAANKDFYTDVSANVSGLRLRAQSQAKAEITVKQIAELETNLGNLRKLHELGGADGLRTVVAEPALSALETNCGAIIKLETAKRTGQEKD